MFSINIQNHLQSKNIEWVFNDPLWPLFTIKLIKKKWADLGFTNTQLEIKPVDVVKKQEKYEKQLAYTASFID